ncbi:hypothetical protein FF38_01582, partial [Lucilia cuprina]
KFVITVFFSGVIAKITSQGDLNATSSILSLQLKVKTVCLCLLLLSGLDRIRYCKNKVKEKTNKKQYFHYKKKKTLPAELKAAVCRVFICFIKGGNVIPLIYLNDVDDDNDYFWLLMLKLYK